MQTLGGIGFTWEHDAHLYLRRAITLHQLAGTPDEWRVRAAREVQGGARRRLAVDLGPEAEAHRAEVRALLAEMQGPLAARAARPVRAPTGYLTPGWPRPWGRDAKALELLVIEEEFRAAKVHARQHRRRRVGAADPDRVRHARAAGAVDPADAARRDQLVPALQRARRRLRPRVAVDARDARRGRLGAQRPEGVDVDGQARPSGASASPAPTPDAPKHDGISCFMVDMKTPGHRHPAAARAHRAGDVQRGVLRRRVRARGLPRRRRSTTAGGAARTTLANERVYMGRSNTIGGGVVGVLQAIEARGLADDRLALAEVGDLVVTGHALAVLGFRLTLAGAGRRRPVGLGGGRPQAARRAARPARAGGRHGR